MTNYPITKEELLSAKQWCDPGFYQITRDAYGKTWVIGPCPSRVSASRMMADFTAEGGPWAIPVAFTVP